MRITRFPRLLALGLFILPWSAPFALDLNELKAAARLNLGDLGGMRNNMDNSEENVPLPSDGMASASVADSPIPDSTYLVGPGDVFQIFYESTSMERQINPEGNLVLNRIGVIHLEGKTLKDAKQLIIAKLQTAHKKSECFANLTRPKTMRVFVTGAVTVPGVYSIPGTYRLSDLLLAAKGFSGLAQRGTLRLIAQDGSAREADIGAFLVHGDLSGNPYLTQGCMLNVPFLDYQKPWVTLRRDTASVAVQLEPGDHIQDVLLRASNFTTPPLYAAVQVKEKDASPRLLGPDSLAAYEPKAGAVIEVFSQKREVYVGGSVLRPGFQIYHSSNKVIQYVSDAGIMTTSKIPDKMEVIRASGEREWVPVKDGELRPGDMVYVDQNAEQRFITYTPIVLGLATLAVSIVTVVLQSSK